MNIPSVPPPPGNATPRVPGYWYGVGVALITVGLISGIALFISGMSVILQGPTHEFDGTSSTTVPFDEGASMILYVADTEVTPSLSGRTRCVARDETNRDATVTRYGGGMTINRWNALYVITARDSGSYTISCAGPSDQYYGVGPRATKGAKTAAIAGPLIGISLAVAGIVVLIVTALRRRPPPPPPYPGPPQYPYPYR